MYHESTLAARLCNLLPMISNDESSDALANKPISKNWLLVGLKMTLESGMDELEGLKELVYIDIHNMDHRVGVPELEWMVANLPMLKHNSTVQQAAPEIVEIIDDDDTAEEATDRIVHVMAAGPSVAAKV
ncbi:hypothetical protein BGX24_007017 [Mortierella sp. AD032]|nr:hypothetical protein BGX24_007017 [Mortierella sp. AD032]